MNAWIKRIVVASTVGVFAMVAQAGLPSEVWVDDGYVEGGGNDGHVWSVDAFATVQDGVNAVAASGTVNVATGTYKEFIEIDRALTLHGAPTPIL